MTDSPLRSKGKNTGPSSRMESARMRVSRKNSTIKKPESKDDSSLKFKRKASRPISVSRTRPKKIDDKKELEISCENANIERAIIQTKSNLKIKI